MNTIKSIQKILIVIIIVSFIYLEYWSQRINPTDYNALAYLDALHILLGIIFTIVIILQFRENVKNKGDILPIVDFLEFTQEFQKLTPKKKFKTLIQHGTFQFFMLSIIAIYMSVILNSNENLRRISIGVELVKTLEEKMQIILLLIFWSIMIITAIINPYIITRSFYIFLVKYATKEKLSTREIMERLTPFTKNFFEKWIVTVFAYLLVSLTTGMVISLGIQVEFIKSNPIKEAIIFMLALMLIHFNLKISMNFFLMLAINWDVQKFFLLSLYHNFMDNWKLDMLFSAVNTVVLTGIMIISFNFLQQFYYEIMTLYFMSVYPLFLLYFMFRYNSFQQILAKENKINMQ